MTNPPPLRHSRRIMGEPPLEPEEISPPHTTEPNQEDGSISQIDDTQYHTTSAEVLLPNNNIPETITIAYDPNQGIRNEQTQQQNLHKGWRKNGLPKI